MSTLRLLLVINVFGAIFPGINCSTETREENVEKHSGDNVTFACYEERLGAVRWEFRRRAAAAFQTLQSGARQLRPEYSSVRIDIQFSISEQRSRLTITKLDVNDTGHYRCISVASRQPMLNAYLTVVPPRYTDIVETSNKWKSTAGAVCGVVLPVLVAAIVVAIVFRHRFCKPKVNQSDSSSNGRRQERSVIDGFENASGIRPPPVPIRPAIIPSYLEVTGTSHDSSGVSATTGVQKELPRVTVGPLVRRYEDLHHETLEPERSHVYKQLRLPPNRR